MTAAEDAEDVRRMREAVWKNSDTPGTDKLWHATLPGVRAQLRLWNASNMSPLQVFEESFLRALLQAGESDGALLTNPLRRISTQPETAGAPFTDTLLAGEFLLILAQAGTEILVQTGTHTARCYLPADKWALIGVSSTQRHNLAQLGIMEGSTVSMSGPALVAAWTGSDAKQELPRAKIGPATATPPSEQEGRASEPQTRQDVMNGGPQWVPPPTPLTWLASTLALAESDETDDIMGHDDAETRLAEQVLQTYCPTPHPERVQKLADWLRQHVDIMTQQPDKQPLRWMWDFVLYLWALENAGMPQLRETAPALQEDLLSQLGLPAWVRNAIPFSMWRRGLKGMQPGHSFIAMNTGSVDRARSLLSLVPAQRPATVTALETMVEGATRTAAELAEEMRRQNEDSGEASTGIDKADDTPKPPDTTGGNTRQKEGRGRSRSPPGSGSKFPRPPGRPRTGHADNGQPPGPRNGPTPVRYRPITPEEYGSVALQVLAGCAPDCPAESLPRLGKGIVNMTTTDGHPVTQACAMSSVMQLLGQMYNQASTEGEIADLVITTRQIAAAAEDAPLEISDAWWVALMKVIPRGPWPGLLVIHAPDKRIVLERTLLLRPPGPIDDRLVTVIGDGGHFDPVWWPIPGGASAVRPAIMELPFELGATCTANFGPAAGLLLILGATYVGRVRLARSNSCNKWTRQQALDVAQTNGSWQEWFLELLRRSRRPERDLRHTLALVVPCRHPMPPYPDLMSTSRGLLSLAPLARIAEPEAGGNPQNIVVIGIDDNACHFGEVAPEHTQDALTRLREVWDSPVAEGHRGL